MKLTKLLIVFILTFLVAFEGYAQTQLENEVITSLLKSGNKLIPVYKLSKKSGRVKSFKRFKMPEFVLINATQSPLKEESFDTLGMFERKVLLNEDRDMLHNFCANNASSLTINFVSGTENTVFYIPKTDLKKLFAKKDDWHSYYKTYDLKPLVTVSRPGFNRNKNKAFIYLTYSLGKNDGAGYYLVMKKSWGKWKIKGPMLVWVS